MFPSKNILPLFFIFLLWSSSFIVPVNAQEGKKSSQDNHYLKKKQNFEEKKYMPRVGNEKMWQGFYVGGIVAYDTMRFLGKYVPKIGTFIGYNIQKDDFVYGAEIDSTIRYADNPLSEYTYYLHFFQFQLGAHARFGHAMGNFLFYVSPGLVRNLVIHDLDYVDGTLSIGADYLFKKKLLLRTSLRYTTTIAPMTTQAKLTPLPDRTDIYIGIGYKF